MSDPASDPRADLKVLDQYKTGGFVPGYPLNRRTFFAPVDQVSEVITHCLGSATKSIVVAMFGFADQAFADILLAKMKDEHVTVQLVLDKSQAGGTHEKAILAAYEAGLPKTEIVLNDVTVGMSEHGAIQHLKILVIDSVITIGGSTNFSEGAVLKQDNECTVTLDPYVAAEATNRIRAIRMAMIKKSGAPVPAS